MDFTKNWFKEQWGEQGYQETFLAHYPYQKEIEEVLNRYSNKTGSVLELGCGSGYWTTQFLIPRFGNITALDVINTPVIFKGYENIKYVCLETNDYSCFSIPDNSIDFVWSFGLFCHLSNNAVEEYLKNICRVMKPKAKGLIMFANWPRSHKSNIPDIEQYRNDKAHEGWFYSDLNTTIKEINGAGLKFIEDAIPTFRDTLAAFVKE